MRILATSGLIYCVCSCTCRSVGGMQRPQPPAPQGAQKRPLEDQNSTEVKRPRTDVAVPPAFETLPEEGKTMDLETLSRRFEALRQEVNGLCCCHQAVDVIRQPGPWFLNLQSMGWICHHIHTHKFFIPTVYCHKINAVLPPQRVVQTVALMMWLVDCSRLMSFLTECQ